MNIYSLLGLRHSYGNHPTLDVESLDIPEGGVIGLVGPNGSGKSTLLKILAFLEQPVGGKLLFAGQPVSKSDAEKRRDVTLLLQEPYLLRRTVRENIAYGLELRELAKDEIAGRVDDSLLRVGLDPELFAERPWFRLSGGEVQRVALAARLALRPRALLLDEPTANVDESSAVLIKEAVWHAWHDWRTTIVVATHDRVWLHEVATAIVSLHGGRVIGNGAENLIQGVWRAKDGYMEMSVGDTLIRGRREEGSQSTTAILNPSCVLLHEASAVRESAVNYLTGVLTQLSLERATGEILGLVDCSGLLLRLRFSREAAGKYNLYPGMELNLSFDIADLKFI